MSTYQCIARVQMGTYSYAARNSERQCFNLATHGDYCHVHKSRSVERLERLEFDALIKRLVLPKSN